MTLAKSCEDWRLLVQAEIDGELQPADAARVEEHVQQCDACRSLQAQLIALSGRMREGVTRFAAPPRLRNALQQRVTAKKPASRRALVPGLSFGAGFAVAACLAVFVLVPGARELQDDVVAAHIRGLQPGHLMDVVSSDHHTVKPWFDGRLPFAPPVKELAADGFPLAGGRLDYLEGRTAAALIYQAGRHVIDLFVWPDSGAVDLAPTSGSREGYHFIQWRDGGMAFWAVSDLDAQELSSFVGDWRKR